MANWWDALVAPFAPARISGYDFGTPEPAGGWSSKYPGQSFGWTTHLGTDFGTPAGEEIFSPGAGVATFQSGVPGYGNLLTDTLANGYQFLFGHVASGISGPVAEGQAIGTTGHDVGSSVGAVTLLAIKDPSGRYINPDPVLAGLPQAGDAAKFMGINVSDPTGISGAISGLPSEIGHGLASFFAVTEQDIAHWLSQQAVAALVAAIVLMVLFL